MNKLFLGASLLFISVMAGAQSKLYNADSLLKQYGHEKKLDMKPFHFQKKFVPPVFFADTARYKSTVVAGHIYSLPHSNMPCLKPLDNSPVTNSIPGGKTPHFSLAPPLQPSIANGLVSKPLVFETPPPEAMAMPNNPSN